MKMQHKRIFSMLAVSSVALFAAGCNVLENPGMINAGGSAIKAMSLSKDEVVQLSNQSCAEMDAQSTVASASSAYGRRLAKIVAPLPKEVNGQQINYKVYQVKEVNAWAMDNGCVRVYAGLLDLMNDDEVRGVIGHELGHVALGHSAASMRTAYATSAVRQAAAASGNSAVSALSRSAAGELGEKFINAQFSQSQETAADNHSFELLTKLNLERKGLVTAFQKLAKLGGGGGSMLDSHPPSEKRAENMQNRLSSAAPTTATKSGATKTPAKSSTKKSSATKSTAK